MEMYVKWVKEKWKEKRFLIVPRWDSNPPLKIDNNQNILYITLVASPQKAKSFFAGADLSTWVLPGQVPGFQAGPEQIARIGKTNQNLSWAHWFWSLGFSVAPDVLLDVGTDQFPIGLLMWAEVGFGQGKMMW